MTFNDVTKMMLNSMDFFELRRTAARYTVAYQGVRRQKLIKDIEKKLLDKNKAPSTGLVLTAASRSPEGAVSAKPNLKNQKSVQKVTTAKINNFSARNNTFNRI